MADSELLLQLPAGADPSSCERLAQALSRECEARHLGWQVRVGSRPVETANRTALVLTADTPSARVQRRGLRRHPLGDLCLLRLGNAPVARDLPSSLPVFDLRRWPGRDAEAGIVALADWLSMPLPQQPPERAKRHRVALTAACALAALLVAVRWHQAAAPEDAPEARAHPDAPPPQLATAEDLREVTGTLDYRAGLLGQGMHVGVVQGRWREADALITHALSQARDDPHVAGGAARYWLVRGRFDQAERLLRRHAESLAPRDRSLLSALAGDAASDSTLCAGLRGTDTAALDALLAGGLDRATLLDDVCVARFAHGPHGALLRERLQLH